MHTITSPLDAYLREWHPVPVGTSEAYRLYARTMNVGVARRCAEKLSAAGELSAAGGAAEIASKAELSSWISPEVAFAWFVGLEDGTDNAAEALRQVMDVVDAPPPPLAFAPSGPVPPWLTYAQRGLIADRKRGAPPLDPMPLTPGQQTIDDCKEALALLRAAWPEMADTTATLVRQLRWLDVPKGYSYGSGTVTQAFGAVFLTPAKVLGLYESLVHESSHLELTVRMALDKLIVNREERAASPLRPTARPLSRVLHATFVCARLAEAFERCLGVVSGEDSAFAASRIEQAREGLIGGCRTLAERCQWTAVGADLFDRLRSDFGIDPRTAGA